ncbi:MBL fold metallo-hydrolase [Pseudomaricurvus sp.]|uniref:MBL fold metallo-hydrolase n=1 Tax=Pseudomaricurvus sp. TaxID=2004510 RepID=UPI003F6D8893
MSDSTQQTQTEIKHQLKPDVLAFFDSDTNTLSYVVKDPQSQQCAIIDPVLNFDYASGSVSYAGADAIIDHIQKHQLQVSWLIETHVHADHLSSAPYIQEKLGGTLAIGEHIRTVQDTFGKVFNAGTDFERDGSQFDHLFKHNETYHIGQLECHAIHTPGHTPACMAHIIGDAIFVGDTLFMPDAGTARADFPGGDAATLYNSVQRLMDYPNHYRMYMCHDYCPDGRELEYQTTVGEQRRNNIHIGEGKSKSAFVAMREERDSTLDMPRLILPSLQVNMRAGQFPAAEDNDQIYLKVPINAF